ncbi:Zinc/iron permease [Rhizopus microsporus ATCC 52813]|uniref:Zinc/iron permease n=1 Tax=Rhizopus microsporus ATCC 52813 TaxID=1340429 RepID=A0A2G4SWJ2_RHIZD|nr:Zinc/iron permease [Rhizopus microsporus ATCC 52813]PHZ13137.1 Zinc/iron permease [Rhizopus microsporus ATCC 52813]
MFTTENNNLEAWLGVIVSSIACIIGASIVFIDILFHRSLLDSRAFMASSMSLASGVLLFSSLSIMFPQAQKRLQNDALLYACYFAGATFTLLLTKLIHYLMPDAIHACGDASDSCQDNDNHSHDERRKLSKHRCDAEYGTMRSSESHFILHYEDYQGNNDAQNEDSAHEHSHHHHHHHHDPIENVVGNDPKHYLSMGIQTAIAICVHKFPEGLIMFVSTKASSALGLSVSIALSIHNLTEGFMIALPLYYATRSRMIAFSAASLMGGLSQPLGALVGLLLVKNISKSKEDVLFGAIFACISGMMSLITIQSMLPQAIRADMEQRYILLFFFLGIFIVGLSSVLGTL